ncbi:MAG: RidA family protein [Lactobacillales bacterium]|jgi:2-iminobutanoate/2-iminopropanoate deaminase|nr:RidA family protein [Lactobacillales bacterium]
MKIENFESENYNSRAPYTHVKKMDLGSSYLIFVSGVQAPADENKKVLSDNVAEQTHQVFKEVEKRLKLAGATLDNVVKVVIYLTDMDDFAIVSPIRTEYFKNAKPVSTMVEVNRMTRNGTKIEIEVTALLDK